MYEVTDGLVVRAGRYDLGAMSLNPSRVELGVCSTFVLRCT